METEQLDATKQTRIIQWFSNPKSLLIIIALFHVIGLILSAIDYYLLHWYIVNYNDGLVADQQYFIIRGENVLSGKWPYEGLSLRNSLAPPLSMYILAVPLLVERIIPIPLAFMYRIYFSMFNIATSWLLLKIGEKQYPGNQKTKAAVLFGISPFMVVQATFPGSDECFGAFLMVLVVYFIVNNSITLAVLSIGFGTAAKYYPSLLIPYLLATRSSRKDQVVYGMFSLLSIFLILFPFYFAQPAGFMEQFRNRVGDLPWHAGGNSGLVILLARSEIFNFAKYNYQYRIFWMGIVVLSSLFQVVKRYDLLEDALIVPSIFFLVYPKFFFPYFAIILPFYCISFVNKKNSWNQWLLLHIGLTTAGILNSRVVGYESVYRQEPGNVPILMIIGLSSFFVIWIYLMGLVIFRKNRYEDLNQ
ncbi:MAG: hypothetical protein ACW99Q_14750 [Candidatus Kariarchaeaceae archaeon]|jgi:hypothetical protein